MSIDTRGMLMVGRWVDDLHQAGVDQDRIDELLDEEELASGSPYYDSPRDQWFVGIEVDGGEITKTVQGLHAARAKFLELLGIEPDVEGVANVY